MLPRTAVVIPAYNHGATVADVAARALDLDVPVIVVDDGSTDDTRARLCDLGIRVLRHPRNLGKGAAILTGLAAAREIADWAVTIDADGQHDPADIPDLVRAIPEGSRPIVVGVRQRMTAAAQVPWASRFGRGFSNFWVRACGGPALQDSQSGLRVYPLPETLELGVVALRFQFEVEVLVRAGWAGMAVLEAPVSVRYPPAGRRVSHYRPVVDFVRNGRTFTRLLFGRTFGKRP